MTVLSSKINYDYLCHIPVKDKLYLKVLENLRFSKYTAKLCFAFVLEIFNFQSPEKRSFSLVSKLQSDFELQNASHFVSFEFLA